MARDGSGSYSLPQAAFTAGTTIESAKVNSNFSDIASALTASLAKDGQTTPTANLPMGTYRHTGVGNASARTDYAAAGQVADNAMLYAADTGAADACAIAPAPGITAYAVGQRFTFKVKATNLTTTPTLAVNGLTAGTIVWPNGTALLAGDLPINALVEVVVAAVTPVFHLQTVSIVGTVPTQAQANNSTKAASTAYVDRVAVQQVVSTVTGAVATGSTALPFDDTIPQNTEGDQYMSLSITPKSATSKLVIEVVFNGSYGINAQVTAALFQDSTADALAAASAEVITGAQTMVNIKFTHTMTSGTTSATTFKVRAGGTSGGTNLTFNGRSSARTLGGVMASSIVIWEVGV